MQVGVLLDDGCSQVDSNHRFESKITLVINGKSLLPGSLSHLTYSGLISFYAKPSFRVMTADLPSKVGPGGRVACPLHCTHASCMSGKRYGQYELHELMHRLT